MTGFVFLRSIIRTTLYDLPSSIFLIKSDIEVEPKCKGALRGAYIEICVHLTTCNPGHILHYLQKTFPPPFRNIKGGVGED